MRQRILAYGILAFGLSFLLACIGFALPFELILYASFGWIGFLFQVAPRATVAWDGVALALLCGAGAVALSQALGGWLIGEVAPGRTWRLRWTLSGLMGVVLMFTLGIAAAGVAHQVGWVLTTPERLVGFSLTAARRVQSVHNLKQIGLALNDYAEANGSFPPAATVGTDGRLEQGWQARISPDFESDNRNPSIRLDLRWDDPVNATAIRTPINTLHNPGITDARPHDAPAPSHYAGNAWVLGGTRAWTRAEITDGTANTVLVGEAAGRFRPWADPHSWRDPKLGINRHPEGFGSPFPNGANFLMADGSVRFILNSTTQPVFEALCTPDGGEQIAADRY